MGSFKTRFGIAGWSSALLLVYWIFIPALYRPGLTGGLENLFLAGLGSVSIVPSDRHLWDGPTIQVHTSRPVLACMASLGAVPGVTLHGTRTSTVLVEQEASGAVREARSARTSTAAVRCIRCRTWRQRDFQFRKLDRWCPFSMPMGVLSPRP